MGICYNLDFVHFLNEQLRKSRFIIFLLAIPEMFKSRLFGKVKAPKIA